MSSGPPAELRALVALSTHLVLAFSESENRDVIIDALARSLHACKEIPAYYVPLARLVRAFVATRSSTDEFRLRLALARYHAEVGAYYLDQVESSA